MIQQVDLPLEYPTSGFGLRADFRRFHEENPHVFREIVRLCRRAKERGHDRWSINGIFEVLRWQAIETDEEKPTLNNNYRAFYARLVMDRCPDLAGFFEIRERTAE